MLRSELRMYHSLLPPVFEKVIWRVFAGKGLIDAKVKKEGLGEATLRLTRVSGQLQSYNPTAK